MRLSDGELAVINALWYRFPCGAYFYQLVWLAPLSPRELEEILISLIQQGFIEKRDGEDGFRKHRDFGTCAMDGSDGWAGVGSDPYFSETTAKHIMDTIDYVRKVNAP